MKKIIIILIMLCSSIFCFSFSKPKHDNPVSLKGYIRVYGNEPFTFIGIVCDSGEEYALLADDNILNELRKSQGKKIQIKGYTKIIDVDESAISFNSLKDGKLIVKDWKIIK